MPVPDSIRQLCETFRLHREHYTSPGYNETELRREFLDPFFAALGWDVDNKAGYADAYKDVIHEDAIRIGGFTKAPDYCFRIGGTRKFFVEAKKPSVNIDGDVAPAYQVRRYGWSAKLPLCILSDFEELAVYDTRIKPVKTDRPSKARILYYTFDQYVDKWDEIARIFARDAILRGSFDKYADTAKGKRGTGAVDDTFLAEIERWRDLLARNLALRNPKLSVRDLNFAVQKTIDRIIFLRICEDRGTEDYGRLQTLLNGPRTYKRLQQLLYQADARYNSGLFHFDNGEKGRSDAPDTLTPHLEIDDKALKDILKNLYYPDSPFEFSVLPADILGQVYEQFLGKTIRLTDGHQARIEEKPEVRKAGGVYYTPSYIVDYIVKNTLGRLLDGDDPETPKPVSIAKAAEIKVLDPACGSGSFLIVAYQYLLDWHLRQYTAEPATGELEPEKARRNAAGKSPKIYQAAGDTWRLTTAERKRILLNNIHGVDIDAQAVEVTKLSLLLKVLEGETQQQLQRDFLSERQRILPDLGGNIKCGNSLIGPDFYENEQMLLLDDESQYRINVFDWKKSFPDIMQRGGFDCVIGNPPYGNPPYVVISREETPECALQYLNRFVVAQYKTDLYHLFLEKGLSLIAQNGRLAYIVPNTWLTLTFNDKLRFHLLTNSSFLEVVVFDHLVFPGANVFTCLVFLQNSAPQHNKCLVKLPNAATSRTAIEKTASFQVGQNTWIETNGHIIETRQQSPSGSLASVLVKTHPPLVSLARASLGCQAYNSSKHTAQQIKDRVFHADEALSAEYMPELAGKDVGRYALERTKGKWIKYGPWLHDYRPLEMLRGPRILIREIPGKAPHAIMATYTEDTYCHYKTILNVNPPIDGSPLRMHYLLGLLNSRLLSFVFPYVSNKIVSAAFPRLSVGDLKKLPIRRIDFDNPADVALHDKMVLLVERMLDLNKKKAAEKNPNILAQLETQISATDRQIDRLVYQLYDLTEAEIAIVEGGKG